MTTEYDYDGPNFDGTTPITIQVENTPSGRLLARAIQLVTEDGVTMGDAMYVAKKEQDERRGPLAGGVLGDAMRALDEEDRKLAPRA